MTRDHVEFIQSQQLEWTVSPWAHLAGATCKLLSRDAVDGGATALVRLDAGWRDDRSGHLDASEEILVLEGEMALDGRTFHQDCYAFRPAGTLRTALASSSGALLIVFYDREPRWHAGAPAAGRYDLSGAVPFRDAFDMPWEHQGMDPAYGDVGLRWKLMRGGPGQDDMTMLVACPPHLHPPAWRGPQERHDCVEEMFLIGGDYLSNVGVMRQGAYFWRPPGILHGPYGTRSGNYAIIRTLGAPLVNNWSEDQVEISRTPPLTPYLPEGTRVQGGPAWQAPGY